MNFFLSGEYVTLYQMQRAALQQRAREKDHQLASLSAEREDLRRKLQELNQLVQRLLEDRGTETGKEALPSLQIANENQVNRNESGNFFFQFCMMRVKSHLCALFSMFSSVPIFFF